ncbi:unannotated protein [freshwater metagenome]|uniref:Unannotated protein n=1 Tax=freshwater metagenome TaxID=449393 RepID=A0A6J7HQW8_9ZZZZ|nr:hypothetical protein [Actinomycetota bacterium]
MKKESEGSASVEFVTLALPLFVPIFLFLTQFSQVSALEAHARTLAREAVHAYATGGELSSAQERAFAVLNYSAPKLGFSASEIASMRLSFTCDSSQCSQAGERVRADLTFTVSSSNRTVHVGAQEYISPWL